MPKLCYNYESGQYEYLEKEILIVEAGATDWRGSSGMRSRAPSAGSSASVWRCAFWALCRC